MRSNISVSNADPSFVISKEHNQLIRKISDVCNKFTEDHFDENDDALEVFVPTDIEASLVEVHAVREGRTRTLFVFSHGDYETYHHFTLRNYDITLPQFKQDCQYFQEQKDAIKAFEEQLLHWF